MDIIYSSCGSKMPTVKPTGLDLKCACGRTHLIRSHGKKEGEWFCQTCKGTIKWKIKTKAEMLVPIEPVDDQKDLFNIFATPKPKKRKR